MIRLTMTWKIKKRIIREGSKPVCFGMPSDLTRRGKTMGSNVIKTASNTGGRMPAMMPTTTLERWRIHVVSQENCEQR